MKQLSSRLAYPVATIIAAYAIGVLFYHRLPASMVTHWAANGLPNGSSPRFIGVFLMPIIMAVLLPIFLLLPLIDPYKQNFRQFQSYFFGFIKVVYSFFLYLYVLTLIYNLGTHINIIRFLVPAFCLLFYYIGILLRNAKRNWFVGIRTPWTLMNEEVWSRTHLLGAKLFRAAAIIGLLGLIVPQLAFFFIIIPILGVSIFLFGYSYFVHHQTEKYAAK